MGINKFIKKKDKPEVKRGTLFADDRLQLDLGVWMGIIKKPSDMPYHLWDDLLSYKLEKVIHEGHINVDKFNSVQDEFLKLIKDAIHGKKVISFCDYDKDKGVFTCELEDDEEVEIEYLYGGIEEGPEVIVTSEKEKARYDFYSARDDSPAHLELLSVTKYLDKDLNFHHYASPFTYYGSLYDERNMIDIEISYRKDMKPEEQIDTAIMEKNICELGLNASIDEITRSVVKGIIIDPNEMPRIIIMKKVKSNTRNGSSYNVVEEITFDNGSIRSMTIVRNGHTVKVNDFRKWSYAEDRFAVKHDESTKEYAVTCNVSEEQLSDSIVPREYVDGAIKKVDDVKKLSLIPIKGEK